MLDADVLQWGRVFAPKWRRCAMTARRFSSAAPAGKRFNAHHSARPCRSPTCAGAEAGRHAGGMPLVRSSRRPGVFYDRDARRRLGARRAHGAPRGRRLVMSLLHGPDGPAPGRLGFAPRKLARGAQRGDCRAGAVRGAGDASSRRAPEATYRLAIARLSAHGACRPPVFSTLRHRTSALGITCSS